MTLTQELYTKLSFSHKSFCARMRPCNVHKRVILSQFLTKLHINAQHTPCDITSRSVISYRTTRHNDMRTRVYATQLGKCSLNAVI